MRGRWEEHGKEYLGHAKGIWAQDMIKSILLPFLNLTVLYFKIRAFQDESG